MPIEATGAIWKETTLPPTTTSVYLYPYILDSFLYHQAVACALSKDIPSICSLNFISYLFKDICLYILNLIPY